MLSYEARVSSQNGEDGILTYLTKFIQNKTFLEIGWGDGTQNNCKNLSVKHGFSGTGIDTTDSKYQAEGFKLLKKRVSVEDVDLIIEQQGESPGVFSIDIDSFDWWILKALLERGFRPEVLVHEYNSLWGPTKIAIRAQDSKTDKQSKYGASLAAYKEILSPYYDFITVNSTGVNAFYIRKDIPFTMPEETIEFQYITTGSAAKKTIEDFKIDDNWEYEING